MELALARKMIETAIVDPCELRGIDMAFAEVIRDQELRIQELESYMRPATKGELEDRIEEVAAEDILAALQKHGIPMHESIHCKSLAARSVLKRAAQLSRLRLIASKAH